MSDIADACGCSISPVQYWLNKHDIETRKRGPTAIDKRLRDAEWLREQYAEQKHTTYDIADMCGCSSKTVRNWLAKHDIEIRRRGRQ